MVIIYRPPKPAAPEPIQAETQAQTPEPAPAPAEAPPPMPRPLSRDEFALRLVRLFPSEGGIEAARKLPTDLHHQVLAIGASVMHPDPIAGAARLGVWLQFGRGFALDPLDQLLLDKLAEIWYCADPQPMERNPRGVAICFQELRIPPPGAPAQGMVDPLDLLSPNPPDRGADSVGKPPLPPASPQYQVDKNAPPVRYGKRRTYRFWGKRDPDGPSEVELAESSRDPTKWRSS